MVHCGLSYMRMVPKKKKKKKKNPKGTTSGTKRSEVPMMRNLTKRLMIRPYA